MMHNMQNSSFRILLSYGQLHVCLMAILCVTAGGYMCQMTMSAPSDTMRCTPQRAATSRIAVV